MEWHDVAGNFATATVEPDESIEDAMAVFCEHIKYRVIPKNEDVPWDHVRVEFWSDSGRMIAFPSSTTTTERIEKAGCQVVSAIFLLSTNGLPILTWTTTRS